MCIINLVWSGDRDENAHCILESFHMSTGYEYLEESFFVFGSVHSWFVWRLLHAFHSKGTQAQFIYKPPCQISLSIANNKDFKESGGIWMRKEKGWKLKLGACDLQILRWHCIQNHHSSEADTGKCLPSPKNFIVQKEALC